MTLDQQIAISDLHEVSNDDGSLTLSPINTVRCFARVKPVAGGERYAAGKVRAPALYRFTIRNRAVNESQQVVWRGEKYNVRYIGTSGPRDLYIYFDAEKDVAA